MGVFSFPYIALVHTNMRAELETGRNKALLHLAQATRTASRLQTHPTNGTHDTNNYSVRELQTMAKTRALNLQFSSLLFKRNTSSIIQPT